MRVTLFLFLAGCSTDTFIGADGGGDDARAEASCASAFCANTQATSCNDFDETANGWTNDSTIGFTMGTTQSTSTSCPSALQIIMPSMPANVGEPHAYAIGALGAPGDVTVVLDALLPNIPITDSGFVDGVAFFALRATTDGGWSVRLERSGDTAWFLRSHQGLTTVNSTSVPNLLTEVWNHMTLIVHYATDSGGTASLTYQTSGTNTNTVTINGHPTLPNTGASQVTSFAVGAGALSAISQSYTFLYDSIAIQAN
jgi:hypothetical protein